MRNSYLDTQNNLLILCVRGDKSAYLGIELLCCITAEHLINNPLGVD